MVPKVYIVIVNYSGINDTVECLESVFRNNYSNYKVVVIDNNSNDDSVNCLVEWATGTKIQSHTNTNTLSFLSQPPVQKPIECILLKEDSFGNSNFSEIATDLVIISLSSNTGFAGGNNTGIEFVLSRNDADYIWFLNNDTVVDSNALVKLVQYAESAKPLKVGITASKLKFYANPQKLQAVGAVFNKWTASNYQIGLGELDRGQYDSNKLKFDYVVGASMFVSLKFIEEVGPMCEDYFLYFEEIDWSTRGKALGWTYHYCPDSIVFHKLGISTGQHGKFNNFYTSNEYAISSLFLFYQKFYPNLVIMARLRLLYTGLKALLQGKSKDFSYILSRLF